jgi:small subunit ribosomal protein S17
LSERSQRKTRMGKVISDNMEKTVVVAVETLVRHPLYGRTVRRSKKYKAHDETNACRVGDKVLLMETRPISKDKHWRVAEILEKAAVINDVRGERASDPGTDNA